MKSQVTLPVERKRDNICLPPDVYIKSYGTAFANLIFLDHICMWGRILPVIFYPTGITPRVSSKLQNDRRMNIVDFRSRGYKTFFMFNSAEHEIFYAHKC